PTAERFKTRDTPLHKTVVVEDKYGIAETSQQPFSKLQYIEEKAEIPLHTTIPTAQMKSETLAMMVQWYPSEE
ncbi:hypothetical protein CEXT_276151, partial [Caerostris extrusa]